MMERLDSLEEDPGENGRLQVAAWSIHRHLQKQAGVDVGETPKLPMFYTEIDEVSLTFC